MDRNKKSAIDEVLRVISSPLKDVGFRKEKRRFRRESNERVCFIALQADRYGSGFFVNAAVVDLFVQQVLFPEVSRKQLSEWDGTWFWRLPACESSDLWRSADVLSSPVGLINSIQTAVGRFSELPTKEMLLTELLRVADSTGVNRLVGNSVSRSRVAQALASRFGTDYQREVANALFDSTAQLKA